MSQTKGAENQSLASAEEPSIPLHLPATFYQFCKYLAVKMSPAHCQIKEMVPESTQK